MKKKKTKKLIPPSLKSLDKKGLMRCPNCGTLFEKTEDPYVFKPACAHFSSNIRMAIL
jgi:uncharacterized C2H2 Zn-finger protein